MPDCDRQTDRRIDTSSQTTLRYAYALHIRRAVKAKDIFFHNKYETKLQVRLGPPVLVHQWVSISEPHKLKTASSLCIILLPCNAGPVGAGMAIYITFWAGGGRCMVIGSASDSKWRSRRLRMRSPCIVPHPHVMLLYYNQQQQLWRHIYVSTAPSDLSNVIFITRMWANAQRDGRPAE